MFNTNAYHIMLEGDSYSIGEKLGHMVKNVPGLAEAHVLPSTAYSKEDTLQVMSLFDRFCPGLNDEIAGFGDVLKVPVERILFYALSYLKPGCSQMALLSSKTDLGNTLLARNYDFSEKMDDMMLLTTKVKGKYAHIASSTVLFGRSDGINERGLAVSMTSAGLPVSNMANSIRKPYVEGLNFWAVVRSVLENCAHIDEALDYLKEMPIAFNMNLLMTDKRDQAVLFETYDGKTALKRIDKLTSEQSLFSTNHVCLPELTTHEPLKLVHSMQRYEKIGKHLSQEKISQADIRKLLSTQYPDGLMFDYYDDFLGTLRSIVFNSSSGEVNLCFGSPDLNEWKTYSIGAEVETYPIPVLLRKKAADKTLFEMVRV